MKQLLVRLFLLTLTFAVLTGAATAQTAPVTSATQSIPPGVQPERRDSYLAAVE